MTTSSSLSKRRRRVPPIPKTKLWGSGQVSFLTFPELLVFARENKLKAVIEEVKKIPSHYMKDYLFDLHLRSCVGQDTALERWTVAVAIRNLYTFDRYEFAYLSYAIEGVSTKKQAKAWVPLLRYIGSLQLPPITRRTLDSIDDEWNTRFGVNVFPEREKVEFLG